MAETSRIRNQLIKAARAWSLGQGPDPVQARKLRREAVLLNHAYYFRNIPLYRKLSQEEGVGEAADIEEIKKKLLLSDDIFKSYSQEWLDSGDFRRMNLWLSGIYHQRIAPDAEGVKSVDDWLDRLEADGVNLSFSSGTSGVFSFVPRNKQSWDLAKTANICYLAALLADLKISASGGFPLKKVATLLPPETFVKVVGQMGIPDFDAFFLGFKQGRMGNQRLMQELAPLFRKHRFLYDTDLTASVLRCLRRGARTGDEEKLVEEFRNQVVRQSDRKYADIIESIRTSTREGQKVFIFGAPYQFKELCEIISGCHGKLTLNKGSLVLYGGGWKSFTGEALQREQLVKKIADCFELPPDRILEGYSMTEISLLMLRCRCGRFHIPPLLEPVILDEELNPLSGRELRGTFGFLDPLAVSYPGFIISGDHVHLVEGECKCGLDGPAITEIGRARSREIKGCGGIMGSMGA